MLIAEEDCCGIIALLSAGIDVVRRLFAERDDPNAPTSPPRARCGYEGA